MGNESTQKKQVGDVFTPAKIPTVTDVIRNGPYNQLCRMYGQGGFYVVVTGTTKLGKTTLVKSTFPKVDVPIYLRGQMLPNGPSDLWFKIASELAIPAQKTTGRTLGDKAKWGFFGKFGIPFTSVQGGADVGGEHSRETSTEYTYILDTETEVINALEALIDAGKKVALVIDDFHFIEDVEQRREIVKALRLTGGIGVTSVLVTLPQRGNDPSFKDTQTGGRRTTIPVDSWSSEDLMKIATQGFAALNLSCETRIVETLAKESHGSPQIMQHLCLNFCEITNGIIEQQKLVTALHEPDDWTEFFRLINDEESAQWLQTLGLGPKKKRSTRNRYSTKSGYEADGYQLLLLALRSFDDPTSVQFEDLKSRVPGIAPSIDAPQLNTLRDKLRKMNALAHKEMTASLESYLAATEDIESEGEQTLDEAQLDALGRDIAQPVIEFNEHLATPMVNILDPLFAYMLRWHEETFLTITSPQ